MSQVHSFEGGPLRFSRCARRFRSRSRPLRLRAAGALSRVAGRGGGTTLPGKLLWKLDPGAIDRLARQSAAAAPCSSRRRTARRRRRRWSRRSCGRACGSRTTPPAPTSSRGSPPPCSTHGDAELGLFEVDEAALSEVARRVQPRRCCSAISSATSSTATASSRPSPPAGATPSPRCRTRCLVVNGDDPQVGDLARDHARSRIFGLDDPRHARPALQHAADSKYCLRCGTPYDYAAAYVGHLGDYRCPNCGHARPKLDVVAREIELHGLDGASFTLTAPGRAKRASSCRCPASTTSTTRSARRRSRSRSSAPLDDVVAGLQRFAAAFGRFERITIGDRTLLMLLIKNPAGRERSGAHARRGRRAVASP